MTKKSKRGGPLEAPEATTSTAMTADENMNHEDSSKQERESVVNITPGGALEVQSSRRSTSRDSSLNDDPKSYIDSISAASVRQNWSQKDMAEDDPSISSIKGDSISATIADYNRKHRAQASDNQSKASGRLAAAGESVSTKQDDSSVNINYYAAGSSTSGAGLMGSASKVADFASVSSNANIDAFDIIEESSNVSSCEDINRQLAAKQDRQSRKKNVKHNNHSHRHHDHSHHHQYSHNHHHHHHHQRRHSSSIEQSLEFGDLPQEDIYQIEPIIIRGNGNLTLFGLSNSFNPEFPSSLLGRVSKEEFDRTIRRINMLLRDQQSLSAKLLLIGSIFCCCSLGFSLIWPSIALKKRSKTTLEKFLANENSRLYSKLGLNWKLAEQRCYSNHAFVEYVLKIEFTPKINLYLPD